MIPRRKRLWRRSLLRRTERCKSGVGALEYFGRLFGKLNLPLACDDRKDPERLPGTKPTLGNLFQMFQAVDNVTDRILVRQIEKVYRTCCMSDVDREVDNLPQPVRAFVQPKQFRDGRG